MRETLYDFCIRTGQQTLLQEWDAKRNAPLTPKDLSYGSKKKVWWRCAHGHVWQAMVTIRTANHSGCPYCSHQRPWPGENDLTSQLPKIAAQWDMEKNAPLTPEMVTRYSNRCVWWRCEKGHFWKTLVRTRTHAACGCPYCAGRKVLKGFNDLFTCMPEIAAQWHPTLNGTLTPYDVTHGSKKKVWWICEQGHVWCASIASRTGGKRCGYPVCAGKVKAQKQAYHAKMIAEHKKNDR